MAIRIFDPTKIVWIATFTILGEPASKANSRVFGRDKDGTRRSFKSPKANKYVRDFVLQCPKLVPLLDYDLIIAMKIFYASRRPDLDESLILDAMQGRIYTNDRLVKERHTYWALDKNNPRTSILVARL